MNYNYFRMQQTIIILPFSPVHNALKFSAVLGTWRANIRDLHRIHLIRLISYRFPEQPDNNAPHTLATTLNIKEDLLRISVIFSVVKWR